MAGEMMYKVIQYFLQLTTKLTTKFILLKRLSVSKDWVSVRTPHMEVPKRV